MPNKTPAEETWDTDDGSEGYRLNRFYVSSTNKKGASQQSRVSLPPLIIGKMSQYIQSGKFPHYRTMQDIVRDAVYHRLKWLADEYMSDPEMLQLISRENFMADRRQALWDMQQLDEMVQDTENGMREAIRLGDHEALAREVEQAEARVMVERDPYKSRLGELAKRYRKELKPRGERDNGQ